MSAFEDFVNAELPRRPTLLTVAITSYDGDPNDGGAPAIITGSPVGTFYLQETPDTFWRKDSTSAWVVVGDGAGEAFNRKQFRAFTETTTTMTINVDFNDVGAQDTIATTDVWETQADVTTALDGATNFKYLQDVLDRLPGVISETVTINLASGVHTPRPGAITDFGSGATFTWYLANDITLRGAALNILGSSTKTDIIASPGTVSSSVGNPTPSATFAGTPFAGLTLKGYGFLTSDGAYAVIKDNDDSTLELVGTPSPAITDGVTTGRIVRPSTILRNSSNGSTNQADYAVMLTPNCAATSEIVNFNDIQIEACGGNHLGVGIPNVGGTTTNAYLQRTLCDYNAEAVAGFTPNNFHIIKWASFGFVQVQDHSFRAINDLSGGISSLNNRCDGILVYGLDTGGNNGFFCIRSAFIGIEDPILLNQQSRVFFASCLLDDIGNNNDDRVTIRTDVNSKAVIEFGNYGFPTFDGIANLITNGTRDGIVLRGNATIRPFVFAPSGCAFSNMTGDCVRVENSGNKILLDNTTGFTGSTGNGGYGIVIEGSRHDIDLPDGTDASGTLGELFINGEASNYNALGNASPLTDESLNIIQIGGTPAPQLLPEILLGVEPFISFDARAASLSDWTTPYGTDLTAQGSGGSIGAEFAFNGRLVDFVDNEGTLYYDSVQAGAAVGATDDFCIEFIWSPQSLTNGRNPFIFGTSLNYLGSFYAGNVLNFRRYTTAGVESIGGPTLTVGEWYHYMVFFNSAEGMSAYLNGEFQATTTDVNTTLAASSNQFTLFSRPAGVNIMDSKVAWFALWNLGTTISSSRRDDIVAQRYAILTDPT